jgi:NAD(P)-dependent dehydrogenase (short-subunit alcohol dehydrogenase family)
MISFKKEQIFIITGASSGIGKATALLINELGGTIVALGRNLQSLEEVKNLSANKDLFFLEQIDLSENIDNIPNFITNLKNKYGKFNGLVASAGILESLPVQSINYNTILNLFNINVFSNMLLAKAVADKRNNIGLLDNNNRSSIVFLSSIAGQKYYKSRSVYSATKAALDAFSGTLAKEVAKNGVRVNCVSPSNVNTEMLYKEGDLYKESQLPLYPFGFAESIDVANTIVFLLSNKANFITGQKYIIDCASD